MEAYLSLGCAFNHDPLKPQALQNQADRWVVSSYCCGWPMLMVILSVKKRFNVDSPSFTPSLLAVAGNGAPAKTSGLSPRAASATPFKPKSLTPGKC